MSFSFNVVGPSALMGDKYYVQANNTKLNTSGYLFPNGQIERVCWLATDNTGWYKTEDEARKAITNYELRKKGLQPMVNSTLIDLIAKTVDSFIHSRKMFTAFDVTKKFREDNPNVLVYHDFVKGYVHQQYEAGNLNTYDRKLIPVATPEPWLYYIPGQHDPVVYTLNANATPMPIPTVPATDNTVPRTVAQKMKDKLTATFGGFIGSK